MDTALIGSWQDCDGRIVDFTAEGGELVGRYAALGGLAGWFSLGEVGYCYRALRGGRYEGQELGTVGIKRISVEADRGTRFSIAIDAGWVDGGVRCVPVCGSVL